MKAPGRAASIRALAAVLALVAAAQAGPALPADEVTVIVPRMPGPAGLSESVSTVLSLQIWQTLERANPKMPGKDFGNGAVQPGPEKLRIDSHVEAEKMARREYGGSQMVLWGVVQPYAEGAIVQSFLTMPAYPRLKGGRYGDFRSKHEEEWSVSIAAGGSEAVFRVDLPRRQLPFAQIAISAEVLKNYSHPGAIALYDENDPDKRIGSVGEEFIAERQHRGWALIRTKIGSKWVKGIVRLPQLSANRSEVVDFVGGVTRIFRGDWQGAIDMLDSVVKSPRTPTDVQVDARLLRAMALAKLGRTGHEEIDRALRLNPYLARTAAYAVMERLALMQTMLASGAAPGEYRSMLKQARALLEGNRKLFVENDAWVAEVLAGLAKLDAAYLK